MEPFGYELILDLSNCNIKKFNRKALTEFFEKICDLIEMQREDLYFWDYEGIPENEIPPEQLHLAGISAVQFIITSNITIHTLDVPKKVYVNIFSCKKFDEKKAEEFTKEYFSAEKSNARFITRN